MTEESLLPAASEKTVELRQFYIIAAALFAGGLIIRIILGIYTRGYTGDQMFFIRWMEAAMQYGVRDSYLHSTMQNYPPVFIAILEGYGHVLNWLEVQIAPAKLSSKMLPILFDMGTMLSLFMLFRRWAPKRRLVLLACLAFNPALLADGAVWGQIDVFHSALMVLSVLLVLTQPLAAGVLLGFALLSKFQAIVVVPVFGALLLRQLIRRNWRGPVRFMVGLVVPIVLTAGWFGLNGTLGAMFKMAYLKATDMYPQLSLNAFNLWYHIFTSPSLKDEAFVFGGSGLTYKMLGFILLGVACAFVAVYVLMLRELKVAHLMKAAAFINLAFFLLPTEIHERYGVPAMLFLLLIPFMVESGWGRIRWGLPAGVFAFTTGLNIWLVLNGGFGGKWLKGGTGGAVGSGDGGFGRAVGRPASGTQGSGGWQDKSRNWQGHEGTNGGPGGWQSGSHNNRNGFHELTQSGYGGQPDSDQDGGIQGHGPLPEGGVDGNGRFGGNQLGATTFGNGSLTGWEHYFAVGLACLNVVLLVWVIRGMVVDIRRKLQKS